jgi:hypothetical protein
MVYKTNGMGAPQKELSDSHLLLKVNTLNLQKNVRGILVHNGYFFVSDLMKHFERSGKAVNIISDIKSDPKLDEEQVIGV